MGFCIKCKQESPTRDDFRGWEKFKKQDETGLTTEDILICPNCIEKFQHTKDIIEIEVRKISDFHSPITESIIKIHAYLHQINNNTGN